MSDDPELLRDELRSALKRLRRHAGDPSSRAISLKLERALSHTTVINVLNCAKTPTWGQLQLVVQALDGREDEFHRRWVSIRDAEDSAASVSHGPVSVPPATPVDGEYQVVKDHASLRFDEGTYTLTQKRLIANIGRGPITGYPVRIHVDRFPHFKLLSGFYHSQYPLRADDLDFHAWYGLGRETPLGRGDPLTTPSLIEGWLQFGPATGATGLAPGAQTWIEYEYRVPQSQWGNWFQRAVRHRTGEVSVELDFPADLVSGPDGVTLSFSSPTNPEPGVYVGTDIPVSHRMAKGRSHYSWRLDHPVLGAKYRSEWNFSFWPTAQMQDVGVLQYHDEESVLTRIAGPIDFSAPGATDEAERIARRLTEVADTVATVHQFTNGMGLAAPQVGVDKRVVLLRAADGTDKFLVNPSVVGQSGESVDIEGCLSFFDARGEFPRPESIVVTYQTLDGAEREQTYTGRAARDVAHEIDHLEGKVFVNRMTPRDTIFLVPGLRTPE